MNDKDKEAFEKWLEARLDVSFEGELFPKYIEYHSERYEAWQAACEYKQKEIDELLKQLKHEHDLYKKHLKVYEDENAELKHKLSTIWKEAEKFYLDD